MATKGGKKTAKPKVTAKRSAKGGNGHGGARANSGPKAAASKEAIAKTNAACLAKMSTLALECIDNLMVLARGVRFREVNEDGTVEYFTEAPDRQANEYVLNHIMGKPTERKQIDASDALMLKLYGGFDPDTV